MTIGRRTDRAREVHLNFQAVAVTRGEHAVKIDGCSLANAAVLPTMDEPTSTEVALAAVDALLRVVEQSSADLREFHDIVERARRSPLPPFPRATVVLAQRIVDKLTMVESELEEVLFGLGLSRTPNAP
jgi:hypothetical protein